MATTENSESDAARVHAAGTFDDRFDELAQVAYRVAYRILGDREDAQDVLQETLARAHARWSKVEDAAPAWVSRVAANRSLDIVRRRARAPRPDRPEPAIDSSASQAERSELVDALRQLPKRQREVVVLRYVADLPERDVAALLRCTPGTVKRHAHRGIAALRRSLNPSLVPELEALL